MKQENSLSVKYLNDEITLIFIALLKAWNIRYIVASPGTLNSGFNLTVQQDPYFHVYSAVDERGAAYMATGLAYELGEPVVITCTGATASRNYCSAMTEAYYRKLPIIAATFAHDVTPLDLCPQYVDRSVTQNDVKTMSVHVSYKDGRKNVMLQYNAALAKVSTGSGPVHINITANRARTLSFDTHELPQDIWKPQICRVDDLPSIRHELIGKAGAVHIGCHRPFSSEDQAAISMFAQQYQVPVFVDHTANYHGANKVLVSQAALCHALPHDLDWLVDIGGISGEYSVIPLFHNTQLWRISEDGDMRTRWQASVAKLICAEERVAFTALQPERQVLIPTGEKSCYEKVMSAMSSLQQPELPFSTPGICSRLAKNLPKNTSLHLGILNSLRSMNFFSLPESVHVNCNVGGFGIDGPLSTLVGQSWANTRRLCFGILGDLAFFYDMNALGNRHIGNNLRIILINNGRGEEFRLNGALEGPFGKEVDTLVAAAGHFAGGARAWAESCGFTYMQAHNYEELDALMETFCAAELTERPLLMECFTIDDDERHAIHLIFESNKLPAPPKKPRGFIRKLIHHLSSE